MKIDIEPRIEIADEFHRIVLDTREIPALYVIRLANGEDFSVKFEHDEMQSFLPSKTVSETIKMWEEGIIRQCEIYKKSIETGIHPCWKSSRKIINPITQIWTGRYEECDYIMNKSEIESFQRLLELTEKKLGKMEFVKIC